MPLGFVFVALAAIGLVGFVYASKPARDKLLREQADADRARAARDECLALQDAIAVRRGQGADLNEIARMEAQLANCAKRTGALPAWDAPLTAMGGKRRQIVLEWSNYRSTDWADSLKRGAVLGVIWRLSDDYMNDARAALGAAAGNREGLRAILDELLLFSEDAASRVVCHATPGACGTGDSDRAMEEIKRAFVPLMGTRETIARFGEFIWYMGDRAVSAISGFDGFVPRARAELAALTPRLDASRASIRRPGVGAIPSNVRAQLRIR